MSKECQRFWIQPTDSARREQLFTRFGSVIGRLSRFLNQERDDIPIISTCLEYTKSGKGKETADSSLYMNGIYSV